MDTLLLPTGTNPDLAWATDAYKRHGTHYGKYRDYIEGVQPLNFATEKFRSAFGRQFATFAYNRCAMVVDAHADRLQVEGFGADNDAISQQAQDVWDDNQMDVREGQVEQESFGMGDGYVVVELDPETGDVLIWPQYAEGIRVEYSPNRPGKVTRATRRWVEDNRVRLNVYLPDRIEKYISRRTTTNGTMIDVQPSDWERYEAPDEPWPVYLNVKDTVPVFHFGNNARVNAYGTSELRDVVPLQDAINKTVMDMMVAMEFAAYPQRVLLNVDVEDDATADSIQRFQTGIDRMLALTGSTDRQAAIAEFSAAAMVQYLDVAEKFDQFISRVSKIPARYLTQEATAISGTSKRMDESPFVSKIEDRQRAYGSVWADVMRYALRLTGTDVEPGAIRVNWKPAAPLSEAEQIEQAMGMKEIGFAFPSILREVWGYEPDQLKTLLTEQATERESMLIADFGDGPAAEREDGDAVA